MSDKIINLSDHINKKDLDAILEVNRKAIEIETAVADQNERIIELLEKCSEDQEEIKSNTEEIKKNSEKIDKDLFKIQVLFTTGLISLIIQLIQMFIKK